LNEAIEWCAGYYLSPFASDDIMHPMRISKQVAVFQEMAAIRENLVAVYSGVEFIDSEGITISKRRGSGKFSGFKEVAFRSEFLPSPTFLVIKESILAVGGYNSEYKVEDLYIRLKLTNAGGCFYTIPDVFVKYRRHDDNLSKKSDLIWMEVKKIISEYKHEDIYTGALAFSMMVQAHDSQINSNTEGVKFALKAARTNFRVIFSKSMLKFIVKLFYKPKS
jgi:alpha-1,3-rhamnosyltransferase